MSAASTDYRIYGVELSPYSVKVRSYCRYKNIPHEWINRDMSRMEEFQALAKLPLIPLVLTPNEDVWQDSTPILEKMEAQFGSPSIHPEDGVLNFISILLEEFGDEWGNKLMFHYRWARDVDQISAADRIAKINMPTATEEELAGIAKMVRERMSGRAFFVGSSPETAEQIETSFKEMMALLETHLSTRAYLLGGRPCFGDFGLWAQIYEAWTDPTAKTLLDADFPAVVAWVKRMLAPTDAGAFESWDQLSGTLMPLLSEQVGANFLPWSTANAAAIGSGAETFTVELKGQPYSQKPQKYHARSLKVLREKYALVQDEDALVHVLSEAGCLEWLS